MFQVIKVSQQSNKDGRRDLRGVRDWQNKLGKHLRDDGLSICSAERGE